MWGCVGMWVCGCLPKGLLESVHAWIVLDNVMIIKLYQNCTILLKILKYTYVSNRWLSQEFYILSQIDRELKTKALKRWTQSGVMQSATSKIKLKSCNGEKNWVSQLVCKRAKFFIKSYLKHSPFEINFLAKSE